MKNIANLLGGPVMLLAMSWAMYSEADNTYVGINYTDLELTDGTQDVSMAAGSGRLGVSFNRYLSFEWRAGTGLSTESVTAGETPSDYILDKFYGGYLRAGVLLFDRVYPYAMVGHSWVKVNKQTGPEETILKDNDTSFGVGMDVRLVGTINLNLEYSRYYNEPGIQIEGPSIGLAAHFFY